MRIDPDSEGPADDGELSDADLAHVIGGLDRGWWSELDAPFTDADAGLVRSHGDG